MTRPTTYFQSNGDASPKLKNHRIILALTSGRISGADTFSIELVRELQKQGLAAEIVQTIRDERASDPLPLPTDISLQTLRVPARATRQRRWQAMSQYLEERAPCIYIPNYDWRHSCISPTLSRRVKIVGIAHSDDPQHYEHVARLGRYWDGIVAVSRKISEHIAELEPDFIERLYTIPYGVHVPSELSHRARANAGTPLPLQIVYAGRLIQYQKRVLDLPRIASVLRARGIPFEMTIIGAGPDQAALHEQSADLMRQGMIRFRGSLSNELVLKIFAESDVFILTSDFEGLPVSMLEAMAHGCVPVVTRVQSGIPEIIEEGVNGFSVPIGDIDQFVNLLALLQSDAALRQRCAENAQRTIRTGGYRLEDMVENYMRLFERVITQEYQRPDGKILPPPGLTRQPFWIARLPTPLQKIAQHTRELIKKNSTRVS